MTRALFDTNIFLDIALKRIPHYDNACELFQLIDENIISGCVSATAVTDIYYIVKKDSGHDMGIALLLDIVSIFDVLGIDKKIVINALNSNIKDFEDAIQSLAAEVNQVDVIITRNKKDFKESAVQVFTPKEFLMSR